MRTINDLSFEQKKSLVGEMLNRSSTGNEWADILSMFSLDMHPDTLRKMAPGVALASQVLSEQSSGDSYIERQKIRDLNSKLNAEYRKESRSQLLRQTVRDAVMNLPPLPEYGENEIKFDSAGNRSLVVCIGDSHFGAQIECRGLLGELMNVYNESVFVSRLDKLYYEIVDILEKEKISVIHLYLVGDLIDGMLRQSQLTRLQFGLVEQVVRFSQIMSDWLKRLSAHAFINVIGVSGNHSQIRPLGSKHRQFEEQNLEKIIFWYLKARSDNWSNVVVRDVCDRMQFDVVCGYSFLLLHGDGEKKIEDIAKSCVNLYGHKIDFFICGHLHRLSEFPMGVTPDGNSQIIRVPSMCGMDLYAQNKGYGGRPGAVALVIEQNYGCRCKYPIKLD